MSVSDLLFAANNQPYAHAYTHRRTCGYLRVHTHTPGSCLSRVARASARIAAMYTLISLMWT